MQSFIPSVSGPPDRQGLPKKLIGGLGGRASAVPLLLCLLSGPQTVVPETAALVSPGI